MKAIPVRDIKPAQSETLSVGRFSIRRLEEVLNGKPLQHDLHRHNFFFILLLRKGEGIHEIDFIPHPVTAETVFMLRPGQVHCLQLLPGATGYLVEFDAAFYHPAGTASTQRLRKAARKNICHPESSRFEKLHRVLTTVFEEYTHRQDGYADVIRASLDIFFIELTRQSARPGSTEFAGSYTQNRFEEFGSLLEAHIVEHKLVSGYARLMSLSAYQLNEITKASAGKTASALIDEHIILEAKRNLLATSNQVKEVADLLGYEDVSYFIRFFKKHTGQSPEAFRRNFK